MKPGFIYEWTDHTTGLKYIGKHEGTIDDGYIGSGTIFIKEYNSRPEDFTRDILWYSDNTTSELISEKEEEYLSKVHDEELYYGKHRRYYNQVKNSAGYTSENNPMNNREVVARMRQTQILNGAKTPWEHMVEKHGYDEARQIHSRNKIGNDYGKGNKGQPKSEEHKKKLSESVKHRYKIGAITPSSSTEKRGRKRKTPYEDLLKMVNEFGLDATAKMLGESYVAVKSRYYTAKKQLTQNK